MAGGNHHGLVKKRYTVITVSATMKSAMENAAMVEPVSALFLCIASAPNPRSRAVQTRLFLTRAASTAHTHLLWAEPCRFPKKQHHIHPLRIFKLGLRISRRDAAHSS